LLQFLPVDRLPYRTRARKGIARDTLAFFKGRAVLLILAVLGLIVSCLYGPAHWTLDFLNRSIVMVGLSYGIAFLGASLINTLRIPWLLDAEAGEQIDGAKKRALVAEAALQANKDGMEVRVKLAALLQKGQKLEENLRTCVEPVDFFVWDKEEYAWMNSATRTLLTIGFPNYAVEFRRAGNGPVFVSGPTNIGQKQNIGRKREGRLRRLRLLQKVLENMAKETRP
jgi:hypothetical protein